MNQHIPFTQKQMQCMICTPACMMGLSTFNLLNSFQGSLSCFSLCNCSSGFQRSLGILTVLVLQCSSERGNECWMNAPFASQWNRTCWSLVVVAWRRDLRRWSFFSVSGDVNSMRMLIKCGLMLPGLFRDVLGDMLNLPRYTQQHTFSL